MRRARPPLGRVRGEFLLFHLGVEAHRAGNALQRRAQEGAPNARAAHLRLHRVEQQEQALGLRRAQQERIGGRKPLALAEHALTAPCATRARRGGYAMGGKSRATRR